MHRAGRLWTTNPQRVKSADSLLAFQIGNMFFNCQKMIDSSFYQSIIQVFVILIIFNLQGPASIYVDLTFWVV